MFLYLLRMVKSLAMSVFIDLMILIVIVAQFVLF